MLHFDLIVQFSYKITTDKLCDCRLPEILQTGFYDYERIMIIWNLKADMTSPRHAIVFGK